MSLLEALRFIRLLIVAYHRSTHQLVCKLIASSRHPPRCSNKHAFVLHFAVNKLLYLMSLTRLLRGDSSRRRRPCCAADCRRCDRGGRSSEQ